MAAALKVVIATNDTACACQGDKLCLLKWYQSLIFCLFKKMSLLDWERKHKQGGEHQAEAEGAGGVCVA